MNRDYVCLKKEDFGEEQRATKKHWIYSKSYSLNLLLKVMFNLQTFLLSTYLEGIFLLLLKLKQDQSTIESKFNQKKICYSFTFIFENKCEETL